VVISGFINIYPDQTVPVQLQTQLDPIIHRFIQVLFATHTIQLYEAGECAQDAAKA
jgi:hypothetical protein